MKATFFVTGIDGNGGRTYEARWGTAGRHRVRCASMPGDQRLYEHSVDTTTEEAASLSCYCLDVIRRQLLGKLAAPSATFAGDLEIGARYTGYATGARACRLARQATRGNDSPGFVAWQNGANRGTVQRINREAGRPCYCAALWSGWCDFCNGLAAPGGPRWTGQLKEQAEELTTATTGIAQTAGR